MNDNFVSLSGVSSFRVLFEDLNNHILTLCKATAMSAVWEESRQAKKGAAQTAEESSVNCIAFSCCN